MCPGREGKRRDAARCIRGGICRWLGRNIFLPRRKAGASAEGVWQGATTQYIASGQTTQKNSFRFLWNSESCCFIKHRLELQVILSDSDRCRLQQRFLGPRIFYNPSQAVLNETFCLPGISIPVPRGLPFCHRACSLSTGITAGRERLFKNRGTKLNRRAKAHKRHKCPSQRDGEVQGCSPEHPPKPSSLSGRNILRPYSGQIFCIFCIFAFPLTYPTCGSGYRSFSFRTDSRRRSRSGRP